MTLRGECGRFLKKMLLIAHAKWPCRRIENTACKGWVDSLPKPHLHLLSHTRSRIQQLDGFRNGQDAHVLNLNCDAQRCYTIERILVGEFASNTTNLHLRLWWPEKWTEAWRRSVNEAATKLRSESVCSGSSMSQEPRTLFLNSSHRQRRASSARGWCAVAAAVAARRRALFVALKKQSS
jgi:hypothetical protein